MAPERGGADQELVAAGLRDAETLAPAGIARGVRVAAVAALAEAGARRCAGEGGDARVAPAAAPRRRHVDKLACHSGL